MTSALIETFTAFSDDRDILSIAKRLSNTVPGVNQCASHLFLLLFETVVRPVSSAMCVGARHEVNVDPLAAVLRVQRVTVRRWQSARLESTAPSGRGLAMPARSAGSARR